MSNKSISVYFAVFAVLYFGYTVLIVGHGIHFGNTAITASIITLSAYYFLKSRAKS